MFLHMTSDLKINISLTEFDNLSQRTLDILITERQKVLEERQRADEDRQKKETDAQKTADLRQRAAQQAEARRRNRH